MASSKEYLEFILGQLSELEEITYRAMMGEFIIYYRGKIVGGIYDDRLLVKPVKSAISYMPTAPYELPYEGAKEMLLVDEVDNKEFLTGLFHAMYDELPALKPKKRNKQFPVCHTDKSPLGTKERTSILSCREYRAFCGASFSVSRKSCMTENVSSLRSVKVAPPPLHRLCGYPLWTCRLPPASLKKDSYALENISAT